MPINLLRVFTGAQFIPDGELTKFPNCAARKEEGIDYTHLDDVFEAYQLYMNDRWDTAKRTLKWTGIE